MFYLPTYFHINHTAGLYHYLKNHSFDTLSISFETCSWADHFELQKLALQLASLSKTCKQLIIRCLPPDDGHITTPMNARQLEVVEYASRMNFFTVLHKIYGEGLVIQFGNRSISTQTETQLQNELLLALPSKRWESHHSKTYVPMQAVSDQLSVESLTKGFSSGAQIQELIEYYSDLDFVTSGEFATLVVHELMQNIIDHAWASVGHKGLAAVSLSTVELGDRNDPEGRYQNRLLYAPAYEKQFLLNLPGPGYLELCISDTGIGIHNTLASRAGSFEEWFSHNHVPRASELLAAAFWAPVTRDPGPHRPGHRGLYYVAESIREYEGVLVCQSAGQELAIVTGDPNWKTRYQQRPQLAFTAEEDVAPLVPPISGTHFRILLPLAAKKRRRKYWDLKLSPVEAFTSLAAPIDLPPILIAPAAPAPEEVEADVRAAMISFRQRCREVLNADTQRTLFEERWVWLSCSATRAWRKQHIHILLEEIVAAPSLRYICLVNVPPSVFQPFVLVARHVTSTQSGKLITLLDERGRRGLVCRSYDSMHAHFMRWAVESSAFQPDTTPAGGLLMSFVNLFKELFQALSFADIQFLMARAGIEAEFKPLLEFYRTTGTVVEIAPQYFVEGYIEFDEALRDLGFLRAIVSYIHLIQNYLLRNAGIIAVRRAATRLIEFGAQPDDPNLWIMATPDPKQGPPTDWLLRHSQICVLTDVVCRGETLHKLLTDLMLESLGQDGQYLACISPLEVQLLNETDDVVPSPLSRTSLPGITNLVLANGTRVPVFSILRTSARICQTSGSAVSRPEPSSNILFQPSLMNHGIPVDGEMAAADFIRLAERERAIWLDHISITDEHFNLEFNMLRLLREGSVVLGQFCEQVADRIINSKVDIIVFPDESRIHLALPAIEEALMSRDATLPKTIRLRRNESGDLFVRPADNPNLLGAHSLLLLDDAINSGGTAHQMLTKTLALVSGSTQAHLQVLISRQSHHDEQLLRGVSAVRNSGFSYSAFVRIPVPFYSAISCPVCRARREVMAVALGLGTHSTVAAVLADFANNLAPSYVYAGSPPISAIEPALRYSVPSHDATLTRWQQFTTLSGAKAAISCAIGSTRENLAELIATFAKNYEREFHLAAFTVYTLFSRGDIPESLLQGPETERLWSSTCEAVKKAARDLTIDSSIVGRGACELCLACWCAPSRSQRRMFVDLVKLSEFLLNDTAFYGWMMFLAFIIRRGIKRESEAYEEINATLSTVREQLSAVGQRRQSGLPTVESLMRLRQVMQAFRGVPITEPWLDGVVNLLEMLSYKAGHIRRNYLTEDEVAWGESLLLLLESQLTRAEPPLTNSYSNISPDVWSELGSFLDRPHPYLGVIAKSLTSSLGGWFRAVQYSNTVSINIGALMETASTAEKVAGQLNDLLDQALVSYRQRQVTNLVEQLAEIVRLQHDLHESLFSRGVDDDFAFRTEVENLICPLYDLSSQFIPADIEREIAEHERRITVEGSLFEYFEKVRNGVSDGEQSPRWCVLLAPRKLVDDVLGDILIGNLQKHVLPHIPKRASVFIRADIEGIGSVDHRVRVTVSIAVNGAAWPLPQNMWHKTLGKNRDTMLHLYGGNIHIEDETRLVVEFLSGHF
jgi:hypothetical protein